jgi:L-malate glycosyltransferase
MKHNILYISGWYPTRMKPTLGNFVFKHAECASENNNIRALHVCTDPQLKYGIERVTNTLPFPSTVIYIPQIRIPILGKIINQIKIIRLYISEYKKMATNGFTPDLVHANIAYPIGIVAWILKKKFNLDYVISEHWTGYHSYADPRPGLIQRMIVRKIANKAKLILPVSNDLGKSMKMHGITTPMRTIANVVNTDLYTPSTNHASNGTIRIIHISTLENIQKNIRLLLDAFAKSLAKQPNLELHIITDGDLTDFSDQISSLGIADKIINHGRKDAIGVAEILKTGDFFVLTSNFENLPCVLIESISCGVPVISTNVGGVSEIINEENGMMVPPNNLDELTAAIEMMIEKYKNYDKTKMHQYAVEKYSYKAIGDELTAVYEQCITKKQLIG